MTNFIPVFPLGIVVYPGEILNLHIFEPRYRQLINESYKTQKPFGIPVVLNNRVAELGTLVEITEIAKLYGDGRMDIRTKGLTIFQVLELVKTIPDKLYSGAIVSYPSNSESHQPDGIQRVVKNLRELYRLLNVTRNFTKPDEELTSYDLAHHAGLSLEEEYELLGLLNETQRLEYLKRHLNKVLPVMTGMETLKEKISLNGHFKELKGFTFDL